MKYYLTYGFKTTITYVNRGLARTNFVLAPVVYKKLKVKRRL